MINNNGVYMDNDWIDFITLPREDEYFDGHEERIQDPELIAKSKQYTYAKFLDYRNWTQEDFDTYWKIVDVIIDNATK